jgi:hypothetical protein
MEGDMTLQNFSKMMCLLFLTVLMFSSEALAGGINITPFGWDFGDVAIGGSTTKTFRVEHIIADYPSEIWFYLAEIKDDAIDSEPLGQEDLAAFKFTWGQSSEVGSPPMTVDLDGRRMVGPTLLSASVNWWVDFEISFTPSFVGFQDVLLEMTTNNTIIPPGDMFSLYLSGNGSDINSVPEPSTFLLLGAGISGLALLRRKAHKQ